MSKDIVEINRSTIKDSGQGGSRPSTPLVASGSHAEDYKALLDSGEEESNGVKFVQNTIFGEVI